MSTLSNEGSHQVTALPTCPAPQWALTETHDDDPRWIYRLWICDCCGERCGAGEAHDGHNREICRYGWDEDAVYAAVKQSIPAVASDGPQAFRVTIDVVYRRMSSPVTATEIQAHIAEEFSAAGFPGIVLGHSLAVVQLGQREAEALEAQMVASEPGFPTDNLP